MKKKTPFLSTSSLFVISSLVSGSAFAGFLDLPEYEPSVRSAGANLVRLQKGQFPELPPVEDGERGDWEAGTRAGLKQALTLQLTRCLAQPQNGTWDFAGKKISRERWCVQTTQWFLNQLETVSSLNDLFILAKVELDWYQSVGRAVEKDVLFTGYFYPVLKAKKVADETYRFPIYRKPSDLVQIYENKKLVWKRKVGRRYVPYYTRGEIEAGALKGKGLEIAYASNPVDPYLLEVQGSGALMIQDTASGKEERLIINYGAQNGKPYASLGKVMRDAGVPEEYINMQGIKRYFIDEHPELWAKMSNQNQSKIFFNTATDGPYGYSQVKVTAKHSIAVDTKEFPMGALTLIQTQRPIQITGELATEWKSFSQFAVTQDTGGAIRGPGRVDIYWGEGDYAQVAAGQTAHPGNLYFMVVPQK